MSRETSMKKDNIKRTILLSLLMILVLCAAFSRIIIKRGSVLIYPGDSFEQMYQFYVGGWERMRSLSVAEWDWSLGLGGSFFSYVYYFVTSPFFLLSVLFSKDFIKYTFLYFNLLKMFCLFICSYCWLNKMSKKWLSSFVGSCVITFSGWVFYYFNYNCFLDALVFYPIILYFTEKYLQEDKKFCLIISVGLLGIINYYFLYMFIPFLWMYALFRYIVIHQDKIDIKRICIEALRFAAYTILGVLVSAVVLFPCAKLITENVRFSQVEISHFFLGKKDLFKIVSSLFVPIAERFNPNVLINVSNHNSLGWGGGSSIYSLLLAPCSIILLFFTKNKTNKISFIVFYTSLAIMMSIFPFYRLFQFTIDSRWFYMMIFLNAMCIAYVIDYHLEFGFSKKVIRVAFILELLIFIGLIGMSYILDFYQQSKWLSTMIIMSFVFILLYWLWFEFRIKYTNIILVMIVCVECIYSGHIYNLNNEPIHASFFSNRELSTKAISLIEEYDETDGFYRVLYGSNKEGFDVWDGNYDLFSPNEPMAKNFAGVSFYSTIYSGGAENYLKRFKGDGWSMPQLKGRMESYNLLSTKYWYANYKQMRPPFGYDLVLEKDGVYIYENQYYINLGFAYDKTINETEILTKDFLQQDILMLDYLVTDVSENTIEDYNIDSDLKHVGIYDPGYVHEIKFDTYIEDETYYFMTFGIDNIIIRLYSGESLVFSDKMYQFNYSDVQITSDMKVDRIQFESNDTYGYGDQIYIYSRPLENYDEWHKNAQAKSFQNVVVSKDYIEADITIDENATHVFTSIPDDDGWRVYADGEEIDTYTCQLGFIGFDLTPGQHHIEFIYRMPYLRVGIICSISAIVLAIILSKKSKKYN